MSSEFKRSKQYVLINTDYLAVHRKLLYDYVDTIMEVDEDNDDEDEDDDERDDNHGNSYIALNSDRDVLCCMFKQELQGTELYLVNNGI